ncbi:PAS domain-containing protein [Coraliomargarita algicola]|uniref:histidine kinase n=1 Tax=Coraliomargarita algicola TaxID=3092156 RepID=A0ABZ0RQW9_9BACT|nr:PAS domain-containing protein [Coraliomargarita sp. J2-16]WPJ97902.1 PAS domain-containing protein [Coraliomargarita sp. J2-16]
MRSGRDDSLEAIQYLADLQNGVALIALCRDHEQLQRYKEVIHHLDDYILAEHLVDGELPTRITHAIRRRNKEQTLLSEQARLQSLLNNIPDAIFFKDLESRFTKVNKRMEDIYGQYHETIIGKTDFDLFSREHAQAAFDDEQEIIRTGKPLVAKLEKETFEDGHFNWVNTTKVPLTDNHGHIIGTMGISRDITELKRAQDTLAQERTLLKTIIEHALAGIFVKDLAGRYLVVNKRHIKYLGAQSEADVIGKTLYDFFEQNEAARISATDAQIMQSGQGIENLIDYRQRADGSELWLLTSKVPLQDDQDRCIGLVGISFNVTEQKLAERRLKDTIKTLEETRLQLIEAEKLKTVGRLAAGVAHEVKNPLNVVSLGAEYLEGQIEGPEEMLQVVRDMREAVQKANHVIFELLDYSSPHKVEMQVANINEIISQVLGLMRHNFKEACIQIEETLSSEIEPVRIDASKIEQVFINLFLNAISVMKKGGTLTVRTDVIQMKSTGGNVSSAMTELFRIGDTIVVIEVLDTGTGLSKEDQSKAFDPFYSTKATGSGTGLGLSVTRSIIEMHHGMITLQNRKDTTGAHVRILLPAATYDNDDD